MEAASAEGHDRWRQVAMAGVRGVLIAASCCSPTHRGADGEALWSLKRESRPPSRTGATDDAGRRRFPDGST